MFGENFQNQDADFDNLSKSLNHSKIEEINNDNNKEIKDNDVNEVIISKKDYDNIENKNKIIEILQKDNKGVKNANFDSIVKFMRGKIGFPDVITEARNHYTLEQVKSLINSGQDMFKVRNLDKYQIDKVNRDIKSIFTMFKDMDINNNTNDKFFADLINYNLKVNKNEINIEINEDTGNVYILEAFEYISRISFKDQYDYNKEYKDRICRYSLLGNIKKHRINKEEKRNIKNTNIYFRHKLINWDTTDLTPFMNDIVNDYKNDSTQTLFSALAPWTAIIKIKILKDSLITLRSQILTIFEENLDQTYIFLLFIQLYNEINIRKLNNNFSINESILEELTRSDDNIIHVIDYDSVLSLFTERRNDVIDLFWRHEMGLEVLTILKAIMVIHNQSRIREQMFSYGYNPTNIDFRFRLFIFSKTDSPQAVKAEVLRDPQIILHTMILYATISRDFDSLIKAFKINLQFGTRREYNNKIMDNFGLGNIFINLSFTQTSKNMFNIIDPSFFKINYNRIETEITSVFQPLFLYRLMNMSSNMITWISGFTPLIHKMKILNINKFERDIMARISRYITCLYPEEDNIYYDTHKLIYDMTGVNMFNNAISIEIEINKDLFNILKHKVNNNRNGLIYIIDIINKIPLESSLSLMFKNFKIDKVPKLINSFYVLEGWEDSTKWFDNYIYIQFLSNILNADLVEMKYKISKDYGNHLINYKKITNKRIFNNILINNDSLEMENIDIDILTTYAIYIDNDEQLKYINYIKDSTVNIENFIYTRKYKKKEILKAINYMNEANAVYKKYKIDELSKTKKEELNIELNKEVFKKSKNKVYDNINIIYEMDADNKKEEINKKTYEEMFKAKSNKFILNREKLQDIQNKAMKHENVYNEPTLLPFSIEQRKSYKLDNLYNLQIHKDIDQIKQTCFNLETMNLSDEIKDEVSAYINAQYGKLNVNMTVILRTLLIYEFYRANSNYNIYYFSSAYGLSNKYLLLNHYVITLYSELLNNLSDIDFDEFKKEFTNYKINNEMMMAGEIFHEIILTVDTFILDEQEKGQLLTIFFDSFEDNNYINILGVKNIPKNGKTMIETINELNKLREEQKIMKDNKINKEKIKDVLDDVSKDELSKTIEKNKNININDDKEISIMKPNIVETPKFEDKYKDKIDENKIMSFGIKDKNEGFNMKTDKFKKLINEGMSKKRIPQITGTLSIKEILNTQNIIIITQTNISKEYRALLKSIGYATDKIIKDIDVSKAEFMNIGVKTSYIVNIIVNLLYPEMLPLNVFKIGNMIVKLTMADILNIFLVIGYYSRILSNSGYIIHHVAFENKLIERIKLLFNSINKKYLIAGMITELLKLIPNTFYNFYKNVKNKTIYPAEDIIKNSIEGSNKLYNDIRKYILSTVNKKQQYEITQDKIHLNYLKDNIQTYYTYIINIYNDYITDSVKEVLKTNLDVLKKNEVINDNILEKIKNSFLEGNENANYIKQSMLDIYAKSDVFDPTVTGRMIDSTIVKFEEDDVYKTENDNNNEEGGEESDSEDDDLFKKALNKDEPIINTPKEKFIPKLITDENKKNNDNEKAKEKEINNMMDVEKIEKKEEDDIFDKTLDKIKESNDVDMNFKLIRKKRRDTKKKKTKSNDNSRNDQVKSKNPFKKLFRKDDEHNSDSKKSSLYENKNNELIQFIMSVFRANNGKLLLTKLYKFDNMNIDFDKCYKKFCAILNQMHFMKLNASDIYRIAVVACSEYDDKVSYKGEIKLILSDITKRYKNYIGDIFINERHTLTQNLKEQFKENVYKIFHRVNNKFKIKDEYEYLLRNRLFVKDDKVTDILYTLRELIDEIDQINSLDVFKKTTKGWIFKDVILSPQTNVLNSDELTKNEEIYKKVKELLNYDNLNKDIKNVIDNLILRNLKDITNDELEILNKYNILPEDIFEQAIPIRKEDELISIKSAENIIKNEEILNEKYKELDNIMKINKDPRILKEKIELASDSLHDFLEFANRDYREMIESGNFDKRPDFYTYWKYWSEIARKANLLDKLDYLAKFEIVEQSINEYNNIVANNTTETKNDKYEPDNNLDNIQRNIAFLEQALPDNIYRMLVIILENKNNKELTYNNIILEYGLDLYLFEY